MPMRTAICKPAARSCWLAPCVRIVGVLHRAREFRVAEKNHNAVAHEFVQGAAVFVAERGHLVEVVLREIGAQLHVDLFAADFSVFFDEGAG